MLKVSSFKELLDGVTCQQIANWKNPTHHKLVTINEFDTVCGALQTLAQHNIRSAPCVDEKGRRFIGMIDVLDLVGVAITCVKLRGEETMGPTTAIYSNPFFNENVRRAIMDVRTVGPNLDTSKMIHPITVNSDSTVREALAKLSGMWAPSHTHQMPLVDPKSLQATDMITQTDFLVLLANNVNLLPQTLSDRSVGELGIVRPLVAVASDVPTHYAFDIMIEHGISGLAILDPKTKEIVANLSATDLRGFRPENLETLYDSVLKYLEKAKTKHTEPLFCTSDWKFKDVLLKLAENRFHRIYVVSSAQERRPYGVISVTDLLRAAFAASQEISS